jgi:hypothetical protein
MKIPHFISLILFGMVLYGCAGVPKEIVSKSHDERADVFQEVANTAYYKEVGSKHGNFHLLKLYQRVKLLTERRNCHV